MHSAHAYGHTEARGGVGVLGAGDTGSLPDAQLICIDFELGELPSAWLRRKYS